MTAESLTNTRGRVWAYAGAILGGTISIAANIAHSFVPPAGAAADWAPRPGAVIGSMFWPILLFVAVEILARVQWPHGDRWYKTLGWGLLRFGGMLPVAFVAGLVSYRHLSALLRYYGEDAIVAVAGPLAIDGLMVMAAAAILVTGRTSTTTLQDTPILSAAVVAHAEQPPATTHSDIPADLASVAVPNRLLPNARFAVTNHLHRYGEPMTAEQLAAVMNVPRDEAAEMLASLNGHTPVPGGVR